MNSVSSCPGYWSLENCCVRAAAFRVLGYVLTLSVLVTVFPFHNQKPSGTDPLSILYISIYIYIYTYGTLPK